MARPHKDITAAGAHFIRIEAVVYEALVREQGRLMLTPGKQHSVSDALASLLADTDVGRKMRKKEGHERTDPV